MRCLQNLVACGARFRADIKGGVAIVAAIAMLALVTGAGAGLDLARSYQVRQKLSQSAAMACQYSVLLNVRQSYYTTNDNGAAYVGQVATYVTKYMAMQSLPSAMQTKASPFALSASGAGDVALAASVPTTFMKLWNVTSIPVSASAHCYDNIAALPQPAASMPPAGTKVISEGFETGACATASCWSVFAPGVPAGQTISTATSTFPSLATPTYTGNSQKWYAMGYCLEIDSINTIFNSVPEGSHSAELDCDNGSGTAGNSSISTQSYLAAGSYELRWNYRGRVDYPNYDPTYLCGNAASDLSWANDTRSVGGPVANALRTNQINVYLDYVMNATSAPPTHTTIDGSETLAGSNLIDMCVDSSSWLQRSVKITITEAGYYWLSLAADGQNDSWGGSVDNIMLCAVACTGAVADNFPTAWTGGAVTLYQDGFETPAVSQWWPFAFNADVTQDTGAYSGWPSATATGWAIGATNQATFVSIYPEAGNQSLMLDNNGSNANRFITKPFLLVPGYYQLTYWYGSAVNFGWSVTDCGATPSAANLSSLTGTAWGEYLPTSSSWWYNQDTNIIGVFMSHAQLASTPSRAAYGDAPTYTNPNGTTGTASASVPPNGVSLTSYNSAQVNPLLDICGYAPSWTKRTANIKISKTAYYWLTISAFGTADGMGGAVDNLTLTALGSPYMSSPPSSAIAIPTPAPLAGSSVTLPASLPDFSVVADAFAP